MNIIKKNQKNGHIAFDLRQSKTTLSIYLTAKTIAEGKLIKKTIRFSDHGTGRRIKKGSNPNRKNRKNLIERQIENLIKEIEKIRLKALIKKIGGENE